MKKNIMKLHLNRETLRSLEKPVLEIVLGADTGGTCVGCVSHTTCICATTCTQLC